MEVNQAALLSMNEVATVLGMPRSTIYQLAAESRLPFEVLKIGRALRVRRVDVENYIAQPQMATA